jgi:hypothetical protein
MKVYSLRAEPGEPRYLQATQGNYWFWQRGYEVVPFVRQQLQAGDLDADLTTAIETTLVWGSVAVVREAVARAGREAPPNIDFPPELSSFLGREVREATMGDVRRYVNSESKELPVHVKPRDRQKLFTGKVVSAFRDLISLSGVPDEEPVIVQELLQFRSEWRAYVLRGRALNVSNYKGDGMVFPDASVILSAIAAFSSSPIGYAMDWAVTRDGRTVLVEVNDGFALGNYGMSGSQYTALVECRWRELMGLEDNGVGFEF